LLLTRGRIWTLPQLAPPICTIITIPTKAEKRAQMPRIESQEVEMAGGCVLVEKSEDIAILTMIGQSCSMR